MAARTAPRLSVLLARQAQIGIVFRRVRSKLFQVVVWDRATDTFSAGSWFRGKLYADRSDISPDGRHLIYFAMGGVAWAIPETGGTWTAISRLPSMTAIALWGQGGTRKGGGVFTSNESFWVDTDVNTVTIRDDSGLRREQYRPVSRLRSRDAILPGGWTLRAKGPGRGYELSRPGEAGIDCAAREWAEAGCLRTGTLTPTGLGDVRTIRDFR